MNFAFITPLAFPEYYSSGNIVMVLAQDLDNNPEYIEHIKQLKEQGKKIYLDNGAHEDAFKDDGWLLQKIAEIEPDVVFAPDVLLNYEETALTTLRFISHARDLIDYENKGFKLAAVAQGSTPEELYSSIMYHSCNPYVDWIALSYCSPAKCYPDKTVSEARAHVLDVMDKMPIPKPIHLLGMGNGFEDLQKGLTMENVMSCDSSAPFMRGFMRESFNDHLGPFKEKCPTCDFSIDTVNKLQDEQIRANIAFIKANFA